MASYTRKKREEATSVIPNSPLPKPKYHFNQEMYDYWDNNQKNFRTVIHRIARKINRSIIKINKENWEGELVKLGETDIKKPPENSTL